MIGKSLAPDGYCTLEAALTATHRAWFPVRREDIERHESLTGKGSVLGELRLFAGDESWIDEPQRGYGPATWERLRALLAKGKLKSIVINQSGREVSVPLSIWYLLESADADLSGVIQWGSGTKLNRGPVFISREELANVISGKPSFRSQTDGAPHQTPAKSQGRPAGTAHKARAAREAVEARYPGGVPPPNVLPTRKLIEQVHVWIRENRPGYLLPNGTVGIGDETILVAAGRKKGK